VRRGEALPPVTVFFDGAAYWLADGFHRVAAHAALGRSEIKAEAHQGARRDAILFSTGANAQHGLPRSNEDKRGAVLTLLRDLEWTGWSNGKIAAACRVSDDLVRKLRASLSPPERAGDGEHRSGDDARSRRNAAGDEPAAAGERAGAAALIARAARAS
jgi:hypothetical protein